MSNSLRSLGTWARRHFSPTTRTLFKAGLIDENGKPTKSGMRELRYILWDQHEAEILDVAKEMLKMERKDKREEEEGPEDETEV